MIATIANAFTVPEIRRKLMFTAAMLALYRLGAYIPSPGVDASTVKEIESNFSGSNILGFLNLFSGGSLSRLSLFALGIMPYITASIILQLLTVVVPSLEQPAEGGRGRPAEDHPVHPLPHRRAVLRPGPRLRLPLPLLRRRAGDSVVGELTGAKLFLIVTCLTCGCTLLMWMGELITQRGIGNGISLMIFASIVSGIPTGSRNGGPTPTRSSS